MVGNSVCTSVLTYLVIFFSLLLAVKGVIHQILHLFNRIDKSLCLWQPGILNHSCVPPRLTTEGLLLLPGQES